MSKPPKPTRELAPEGVHNAICIAFLDLGTQSSENFGDARKCDVVFEIAAKRSDGKSFQIAKRYTYSASPKSNLMKDLKAWLGVKDGDFDMDGVALQGAMVTIEHKGEYANITNISGLPKGMKPLKTQSEFKSLYLDETFDQEIFDSLTDYQKEKIAGSPEYDAVIASAKPKKSAKAVPTKKAKK